MEKAMRLAIEREIQFLRERFGLETAVLRGEDLARVLGYPSADALRKSVERKTCPVHVRKGAGKRGLEAHLEEVAGYLASLRDGGGEKPRPRAPFARGLGLTTRERQDKDNDRLDRSISASEGPQEEALGEGK